MLLFVLFLSLIVPLEQMIASGFIHSLGIKQPVTEMHSGTPVVQFYI